MTRFASITLVAALASALLASGCVSGEAEGDDEGGPPSNADECATGLKWTSGDAESPLMHPGGDCIGCHSSGEGPSFAIAGTVQADLHDPLDCYGVPGAVVTVTDANDQSIELTTNEAGNFFLDSRDANLAMPIHVSVTYDGQTVSMAESPPTGACGSCHTADGLNGAPGRILAP